MNADDMLELRLAQGDLVKLSASNGFEHNLGGLQVVAYDVPRKGIVGYYPECNVLIPLWHFAEGSKVPAAKSVPVRISIDAVSELVDADEIRSPPLNEGPPPFNSARFVQVRGVRRSAPARRAAFWQFIYVTQVH
jgi:hypothetical protein